MESTTTVELIEAAQKGDEEKVMKLLPLCSDLRTTLHTAIFNGHINIVNSLLRNGVDPNARDTYGQTTLKVAARGEQFHIVHALLNSGADINNKDLNGQSDFNYLMQEGALSYELVISMLDKVEDIQEKHAITGETLLHLVRNREEDNYLVPLIASLISRGVEINKQDLEGDTPLHNLASVAHKDAIAFLAEHGADVNIRNNTGQTPLHILAENSEYAEFENVFQYLLDKGIDINAKDNHGRTVLHLVAADRNATAEVVSKILQFGVKSDVSDAIGGNEIYHAVNKFDYTYSQAEVENGTAVIMTLVSNGISVDKPDIFGIAPIHLAADKQGSEPLKTLININSDVNFRTKTGSFALHWATRRLYVAIPLIHWYVRNKYSLNPVDIYGSTPLHWAVWFREQVVVKTLLQKGADPNIKDATGLTPGDLATKLQYNDYHDILMTFSSLQSLEEGFHKFQLEFHGTDPFEECPCLSYIDKKDNKLKLEHWRDHFEYHRLSASRFIQNILQSSFMGFYFNIEENELVLQLVERFVHRLHEEVVNDNPVFKSVLQLSGSVNGKTKINVPHEFDYIWNLTNFNECFFPIHSTDFPTGFVQLKLDQNFSGKEDFARFVEEDGSLNGRKLSWKFSKSINKAVKEIFSDNNSCNEFMQFSLIDFTNELKGGIPTLDMYYQGREMKLIPISIDLVPAIFPRGLEHSAVVPKTLRLVRSLVPNPIFSVVLKSPDKEFIQCSDYLFRISYAQMEHEMIKEIPLSIRKGFILVKALQQSHYMPQVVDVDNDDNIENYLTSYFIKTCFLLELEDAWESGEINFSGIVKEDVQTCEKVPLHWAKRIVNRLKDCVEKRNLPVYFEPEKNLLAQEGTKLMFNESVYRDLVDILHTLLDSHNNS